MNFQQDNWADLLVLAEFTYSTQHTSTCMFLFLGTYGFHPYFLQELTATHQLLREQLQWAKEDYKKFADQHRDVPPLAVSDHAHSWWKQSSTRGILSDPPRLNAHPPASPHWTLAPPPEQVLVQGQLEYKMVHIVDSCVCWEHLQYLVDWKGYGPEDMSWEEANAMHAPRLLHQPCQGGSVMIPLDASSDTSPDVSSEENEPDLHMSGGELVNGYKQLSERWGKQPFSDEEQCLLHFSETFKCLVDSLAVTSITRLPTPASHYSHSNLSTPHLLTNVRLADALRS
ncbi:Chromobox protein-like 1, partial [Ophiophagus hannah]